MDWTVVFFDAFVTEFKAYPGMVQDAIAARIRLLEREGPQLGRPHADTPTGSKHANMKELRCNAEDGVWRIAFAFDLGRKAVLLVAGDKSGVSEKGFYKNCWQKPMCGSTSILMK